MKETNIDWIPNVPDNWDVVRLKDIAKLQSGEGITSDSIDETGDYPVYGGNGLRGYTDTYTNDGDYVLIGRQGALCGNINYAKGKFYASEHAVVVYTHDKNENTTWLGETLRMANFNRLSASAAQPGLAVSVLNYQMIPYPPKEVRQRISHYLDAKISEIDKRVSVLEKQQEAYVRLKKSVIHQAVTRGFNPDVPLKDSGIEWIGMIPEHWTLRRIKEIGVVNSGTTPSTKNEKYYNNGIHPWINTGCVQDCDIYEPADYVTDLALKECNGLKFFPIDTLLLAMYGGGTIGNVGILKVSATINQACCAITLDKKKANARYCFYLLLSMKKWIISRGFGGTQVNLSQGQISNFVVALPPLSEQQAIATYLDEKCAKINAAIENIGKQIEASKRLKRAIINEAISGKACVNG